MTFVRDNRDYTTNILINYENSIFGKKIMNYLDFEKALSKPRLGRFLFAVNGNHEEAINLYKLNIQLSQTYFVDETPSIIVNNILKVTPHNTEDNIDLMAQNLDTIIGSIIKQS